MAAYELLVGLRYTRAKRRNHFISFISGISMGGIALGVAALIVVLSVMNGFQEEVRNRILAVVSHIEIRGFEGGLRDWPAVAGIASANGHVRAAAPYVAGQAMVVAGNATRGGILRGIDPAREVKVADFASHLKSGSLDALREGEFKVVLGSEMARALGVVPGDTVVIYVPQGQMTPAGVLPRLKQFQVAGVFEIGMFEYDNGLALVHLADAQKLYRLNDAVSGIRLKLDDLFRAPRIARELAGSLPMSLDVRDWTKSHANFFRAVEIEKRMMFLILTLIVAVAAFNIVSTLVMVVTDKQPDIAILRTLGAKPSSVMAIFMIQGALIGVIGTLLGVIGGVLLATNLDTVVPALESVLGVQFLDKSVYMLSSLPSDLQRGDVTSIALVSLALSFFSTLYPSWRASRVNPVEALRYE
ncbi:Lipoprotein-releasing system transmembrane protein LolE [Burkholderiales bacterium]|nr:MAG: lipoprotein-releasing ABC transporter permease subunit [Burkholderiales bacterium]CAG0987503.1 Lipoprotein-releasing system transmembrane protein LolE [Burkholderiales bacterium]